MTRATNHVAEFGRVSGLLVEDWEQFDELEGFFADKPFERAPQGQLPEPKDW